jgi:hypothetical protein
LEARQGWLRPGRGIIITDPTKLINGGQAKKDRDKDLS